MLLLWLLFLFWQLFDWPSLSDMSISRWAHDVVRFCPESSLKYWQLLLWALWASSADTNRFSLTWHNCKLPAWAALWLPCSCCGGVCEETLGKRQRGKLFASCRVRVA